MESQPEPVKLSYYQRNRDKCLSRANAHRDLHRNEYNRKYKLWYQANKEQLYARRRERLLASRPKRIPKVKEPVAPVPEMLPIVEPPVQQSNVEIINREIIVSFD